VTEEPYEDRQLVNQGKSPKAHGTGVRPPDIRRINRAKKQEAKGQGLDWGAIRQSYADRRKAEGASDEEVNEELGVTIPDKAPQFKQEQFKANRRTHTATSKPVQKKNGPAKGVARVGGLQKSDKLRQEIKECHEQKFTTKEIAELCEVTTKTVRTYLKDLGLEPNKDKPGPPKVVTDEARAEQKAEWHASSNRRLSPVKCPHCGREDKRCHLTKGGFYCKISGFHKGEH
jgi:transposase